MQRPYSSQSSYSTTCHIPTPRACLTPRLRDNNSLRSHFRALRLQHLQYILSTNHKAQENASKSINSGCVHVTGFNVVTALVWRCKALSLVEEEEVDDLEKESIILYAVDIRGRLDPHLPSSYAKAKRKVLLEEPFGRIVEMVGEGANRKIDEYARSSIDWVEIYKGFPHGEVLVSSWWKLGFAEVEYPWGKPKYLCPVVYHWKDIVLLFPDIDGDSKGVYVLAALPSKEMAKFHKWFENTLC